MCDFVFESNILLSALIWPYLLFGQPGLRQNSWYTRESNFHDKLINAIDKSTMSEKEWKVLTKWVELQTGEGPWELPPGVIEAVATPYEKEVAVLSDEIEKRCDEMWRDE